MDLVVFAFGHALVLLALGWTAWSAGTLVAPFWRHEQPALPAGFRLALGFAILTQLLLLLGLLGQLRPQQIVLVMGALVMAAARPAFFELRQAWPAARAGASSQLAVVALLLFLPVFTLALYPPLGFDQTLYHLPFVKAFAASGGMPFLGDLRFPVFPQLAEVLQATLYLAAGEIASQLAGLAALTAFLVLLYAWAGEKGGREAGLLAVAMVAGSPCAVYVATCGYVEPQLALFSLAALYAAERASRGNLPAWALAAGFLAGSAAATKYHGLFFLGMSGLLLLPWGNWRAAPRSWWPRLALFAVAAAVAALPSYGRIVAYTGNPLFPFFSEFFGAGPYTEETMLPRGTQRWLRVLTYFWDISFRRDLVGHLPAWSPVFLLALPMAGVALHFPRWRRPALVALLFWLLSPIHAHYFLAIAGVWAVVVAAALQWLLGEEPRRRRLLVIGAALVALGGPAYALYRIHLLGPPAATRAGQDQLLAKNLPLYPAILFLDGAAADGRVFGAGPVVARMTSYYSGTLLGDVNGVDSVARIASRATELGSLAAALAEIGADYALIDRAENAWLELADRDPRLELAYQDENAKIYRLRGRPPGPS